jgi:hypothetical protein
MHVLDVVGVEHVAAQIGQQADRAKKAIEDSDRCVWERLPEFFGGVLVASLVVVAQEGFTETSVVVLAHLILTNIYKFKFTT